MKTRLENLRRQLAPLAPWASGTLLEACAYIEKLEDERDQAHNLLDALGIEGGYDGELRITGTLTKPVHSIVTIDGRPCTCPSCQMKEYMP